MNSLGILAVCFLAILLFSSGAYADSAIGKVVIYTPDSSSGGGGGGGSRVVTIYYPNITNGTVEFVPEQITIPTPVALANDSGRKILFDIGVKINRKQIISGENLTSIINLINLGVPGRVNVTAVYRIIDTAGNTVYQESEIVPVETQFEFLKDFNTNYLEEGEYTLLAEINYEGQKEPARADDAFIVTKTFWQKFGRIILIVLGELLLIGLIIWFAIKDAIYLRIFAKKVHAHVTSPATPKSNKDKKK
jgi:hypothetical protein